MDGIATRMRGSMLLQITSHSARLFHGVNCVLLPSMCTYEMKWLMGCSTTNFNVAIAVLSVFILLCKGIMFVCSVFHPLISLSIHSGLVAVWAVSIHNQAGSDTSDPKHPQPGAPWYITKSCGPPVRPSLIGYCKQAKAAFAMTILMWYVIFLPSFLSNLTFVLQQYIIHCLPHPYPYHSLPEQILPISAQLQDLGQGGWICAL